MKIMIVEDDVYLTEEVKQILKKQNYETLVCDDLLHVIDMFIEFKPHLVLLDINLPYFDGFSWCDQIRTVSKVPILFMSSRTEDHDKIRALSVGGDDYIDKPFNTELLIAKISALLRRSYLDKTLEFQHISKDLVYHWGLKRIMFNDMFSELTKSEAVIIETLLLHKGTVVSRGDLMNQLWQTDEFVSESNLSVLISRFRKKIELLSKENDIIITKKGIGYYIQ